MSSFSDMGKLIVLAGAALIVIGGLVWAMGKVPFLGRLPGDIRIERGNFSCFFPLATMIIVSIILTVVLNIVLRLINK